MKPTENNIMTSLQTRKEEHIISLDTPQESYMSTWSTSGTTIEVKGGQTTEETFTTIVIEDRENILQHVVAYSHTTYVNQFQSRLT